MTAEETTAKTPDMDAAPPMPTPAPGEVARMSPEQLDRYDAALRHARDVAHAHSRAERGRDEAQKKARAAEAFASSATSAADKAADKAREADQLVSQVAQEIIQELGVGVPGAKLEITDSGAIIDVEARQKLQNGHG